MSDSIPFTPTLTAGLSDPTAMKGGWVTNNDSGGD